MRAGADAEGRGRGGVSFTPRACGEESRVPGFLRYFVLRRFGRLGLLVFAWDLWRRQRRRRAARAAGARS
jgi:hypothetical protein